MFFDKIMAPLGKEYCVLLYIIGLFLFFSSILTICLGMYTLLNKKTRMLGVSEISGGVMGFIVYLLYRIVYTMCLKTL